MDKYLSTAQVCDRFGGVSGRTIKRWQSTNKFPKPVISTRGAVSLYKLADIQAWESKIKPADMGQ